MSTSRLFRYVEERRNFASSLAEVILGRKGEGILGLRRPATVYTGYGQVAASCLEEFVVRHADSPRI
jgi:hypothetical protein